MFHIKKAEYLDRFYLEKYNIIQKDLEKNLIKVSSRLYNSRIAEELYRFGNTKYHLEVFYHVPTESEIELGASFAINDAEVKFGIFDWNTCEPIPLEEALRILPKKYRSIICFNIDHFTEMKDIFI